MSSGSGHIPKDMSLTSLNSTHVHSHIMSSVEHIDKNINDVEDDVIINISNNGQSSSILELGLHKIKHPEVHYINSFKSRSKRLENVISNYKSISFNFLNLDIQGVELRALKSLGNYYLEKVDYIYTEVNCDYVYEKCDLIGDIDKYLSTFGFKRVETSWFGDCKWGDAFYIKV